MTQPSELQEPASLSEQITDLILKVIKPGDVTLGGFGSFWFLSLNRLP
ncbi:MAG TPA: hypothetical protein V6D10_05355 [Trichocoleus sp.]